MRRILVCLLFWSSFCSAQDYYVPPVSHRPGQANSLKDSIKRTAYYFTMDAGVSIPMRDFRSKDTAHNYMVIGPDSTNGKGFANVGFHISTTGGVFITPAFGLCIKIAYNENTFDQSTLNTIINGNYTYSINGNYNVWQFMGGVFANIPLTKRSTLWVHAMIGEIDVNFPSFSIYNLPQNLFPPYLSWNFTLPDATDFAYSLSLGYEQAISRNVGFIATLSYTGSNLVYPTLTYDLTGPYNGLPPPHTQYTPVTMSFGSMDVSVGLLFHL